MDIIQLLPDSVANQIAAGEVIQRPASVIKELVENAIDAKATSISVLVTDAGKAAIQVIDNGVGMSDTDARLSFERHATSKIRQAVDLFSLHTMGFRGEALASIAAVAQVTLQTRRQADEIGTRLVIAGSQTMSQEPAACPVGSNFLVENLFYNIPARRKFLKSNATEMSNITQAFERIALVYPQVTFSLASNGMEVKQLRAGTTHQRITDIFGKKMNKELLSVKTETSICTITGFVAKPESAKKKGVQQYFFVNGRFMKHPYFHKAVMTAYDRLLPEGMQISYFLYLTVDPQDIDVNIHPVKTEIKFENEREIWQILMAAVRNAVGKFSDVGTLDFDTEGKPDIPVFNGGAELDVNQPRIDFNPTYNPFADTTASYTPQADTVPSFDTSTVTMPVGEANPFIDPPSPFTSEDSDELLPGFAAAPSTTPASTTRQTSTPSTSRKTAKGWDELWGDTTDTTHAATSANTQQQTATLWDDISPTTAIGDSTATDTITGAPSASGAPTIGNEPLSHDHIQLQGCYIITPTPSGLMMIDQHRASQRVLFEEYMQTLRGRKAHTQKMLFPELVQFPPSYLDNLPPIVSELTTLGFELTDLGGGSYSLSGTPSGIAGMDAVSLVSDLVDAAVEVDTSATETLHSHIAERLADKAAIPYGELLSRDDMHSLVERLMQCATQRYTPAGQPIISIMAMSDVQRRF